MLGRMMYDTVTLEKQNGELIENINANVQPDMIFIDDGSLPIEESDVLIRKLDNGLVERYKVLERGFYSKQMGISAHYQCKVKKESAIKAQQHQPQQIVYNLNGANSRVNNNSSDSSTNIVNINKENLFENLKEIIKENVEDPNEKLELIEAVHNMERNQGTNNFKDYYVKFITTAANHMTLISPFIPALTQLLE